jgi:hypothetical protein
MNRRKILVSHSLHQLPGSFPFPPNAIVISWDGIPQALSHHYDVRYIPIKDITAYEQVKDYDIILLWQDDIFSPHYKIWDFVEDKMVVFLQTGWLWKTVEMNCECRSLVYQRYQLLDIVLGVVNEDYVHYFCPADTIISDIVNSIEFDYLYSEFYKKITPPLLSNKAIMPHMIEPHEACNWSKHLLSAKVLNRLGYSVGYQSRVYKDENVEFTQHLRSFGLDIFHVPFIDIYDYIRMLSSYDIMFELHDYSACSMGIIAALFGHLPSIGSRSWYQTKLFPDLVVERLDLERVRTLNEMAHCQRNELLEKGVSLARDLDHVVVGNKLASIIEAKWHQLH